MVIDKILGTGMSWSRRLDEENFVWISHKQYPRKANKSPTEIAE